MATKITRDVLESYVHCTYKGHLRLTGELGSISDYEVLQAEAQSRVRLSAADRLIGRHKDDPILRGIAVTRPLLKQGVPLILDATIEDHALSIRFDALQKEEGVSRLGDFHYIPVLFDGAERPRMEQKKLLELYGVIIGNLQGRQPDSGMLIYGQNCTIQRVKLNPSGQGAQRVQEIKEVQGTDTPPHLMLNSHCQICEFRQRCQAEATEQDDLSLLRGLSEKEIRKYNRRGIFTVTQLSFTFRPPKRSKRPQQQKSQPHNPALQALAIRDQKIYVLGTPRLPHGATQIYFDIEGDPDRQFAYLLGMIVERNGMEERYSFWADSPVDEPQLFQQFLDVVGLHPDACLYAYGSYEAAFLRRMIKESGREELANTILARVVNILSIVYAHMYFPTYSNSLKDIGRYLGFSWTDSHASGIQSIVWRKKWEESGLARLKDTLTTYNIEDCVALRTVTELLYGIFSNQPAPPPTQTVTQAGKHVSRVEEIALPSSRPEWCRTEFAVPDFAFINERAYFDYQHDRVFIRTNKTLKQRRSRKRSRQGKKNLWANRSLEITCQECPFCGGTELTRNPDGRLVRLAFDLRITRSGIKRWVMRFTTTWHRCSGCDRTIHADETEVHLKKEGKGYVWVFTNQEEVVFMYRSSREGSFLHGLFKDFRGVLISDFYAPYDSLACEQQKCLIHLIRDFNHDIQGNPWDEDLKALAAAFGHLLRTIIATVDKYGLRQRHLGKHRRDVERFFRTIEGKAYRSEVAEGYRRRLLQYQNKLFTFLSHNGVPWNNNNAEHAVKRFAYYREVADGEFSEAGLSQYLVLLSIYLTCQYKEVSFLQFLLSQETDIDAYCASPNHKRTLPAVELLPDGFTSSRRKRKLDAE